MQIADLLFLGTKKHVLAIEKRTGITQWTTKLAGGMGDRFVTLLVEGTMVFAYSSGYLYGLDAESGRILWKNELPGFGYGFASLAVQGQAAPDPALMSAIRAAAQRASQSHTQTSSGH